MGEAAVHPAEGLLALLSRGAAILELGCGAGNHSAEMIKSDTSELTNFDKTPATMRHLVVRKS